MGGEVSSLPLSAPCLEVNGSTRLSHARDCLPPAHGTGRADRPMGESLTAIGTVVLIVLHIWVTLTGNHMSVVNFFW